MTKGIAHVPLQSLSLVMPFGLLLHCAMYYNCPAMETVPQVLVTLEEWVVLVAMIECPMLVVPLAVSSVAPTPVEWVYDAQAAKQVLVQWCRDALAAMTSARTT